MTSLAAQKYNFKTYDLENELDVPSFRAFSTSYNGYLYLTGNEQIYLFNGKSANPVRSDYSLPFAELSSPSEDGEDNLFLIANNQLMLYGNPEPIIQEPLNTYLFVGDSLFYGTQDGLKLYNKSHNLIGRPESLESLSAFSVHQILKAGRSLIIASDHGLYRYHLSEDRLEDFNLTSHLDLKKIEIDNSGNIWAYDDEGSLYNIDLKTKKLQSYQNQGYKFSSITADSSNRIWFGTTNKGILRYDLSLDLWKTIDQNSGLPDNRVVDLITDSWGTIWVATADLVLSKFIDRDYELYNVYDGLPNDDVTAIYAKDKLMITSGAKGLYQYEDGSFSLLSGQSVQCTAIAQDSTSLWLGTEGGGMIQIKNRETTVFGKNAGLPSDWIQEIAIDEYGSIWIATPSNGIAVLNRRDSSGFRIDVFNEEQGLLDSHVTSLLSHSSGAVYYGTQKGKLGVFRFGEHYEVPLDEQIASEIVDLLEGQMGEVLIGTSNDGLYQLNTNEKNSIERLAQYPTSIRAISQLNGEIYIANDKGVYTQNGSFTTADGFPSGKVRKRGMVNYAGRLWIATADGLVSVGNIAGTPSQKIPKIHFKNVQVDYNTISYSRGDHNTPPTINYNENQISFEYEGVNIHTNKDLEYSFILEGRDKQWSPWSKNNNPSFSNLSAGTYTFQVRARSDREAISEPVSYTFVKKGPLWREWWFLPLMTLLVSILIYMVFRNRLKKIRRKNEEEKAQLELKNRLLELEQKANQLQMNPHFIFNALNSIQSTVAKEDYKDARREITDFASLMRTILSNSKERVISLEDELKLLSKYVSIEKKCRSLDFTFKVNVASEIDPAEAMIPPMLIQPFVENAIVHGLSKKKGGSLQVLIEAIDEEVLLITVLDDGIGYDSSKSVKVSTMHESVAIAVTTERLQAVLEKKYQPAVAIRQVDEVLGGTEVTLKIPVEYGF